MFIHVRAYVRACVCFWAVMARGTEGGRRGRGGGRYFNDLRRNECLTSSALWATGRRRRLLSMPYALWSHGLLSYSQASRQGRNHAPQQPAGLAATGNTRTSQDAVGGIRRRGSRAHARLRVYCVLLLPPCAHHPARSSHLAPR